MKTMQLNLFAGSGLPVLKDVATIPCCCVVLDHLSGAAGPRSDVRESQPSCSARHHDYPCQIRNGRDLQARGDRGARPSTDRSATFLSCGRGDKTDTGFADQIRSLDAYERMDPASRGGPVSQSQAIAISRASGHPV